MQVRVELLYNVDVVYIIKDNKPRAIRLIVELPSDRSCNIRLWVVVAGKAKLNSDIPKRLQDTSLVASIYLE